MKRTEMLEVLGAARRALTMSNFLIATDREDIVEDHPKGKLFFKINNLEEIELLNKLIQKLEPTKMQCKCGKTLDYSPIKNFCPFCGQKLEWPEETEVVPNEDVANVNPSSNTHAPSSVPLHNEICRCTTPETPDKHGRLQSNYTFQSNHQFAELLEMIRHDMELQFHPGHLQKTSESKVVVFLLPFVSVGSE